MSLKTLTDLRKLRHVVQIARAGSITGASNTLAITQSALTKSVAEVEYLLGLKLFQRLPRGMALTDAGKTFVLRAERILNDTDDLMAQLDGLQSLASGRLRIGVTPAPYVSFLESTVSAFAKVYPGIHISVTDGGLDEMAQALLVGQVDLVVGAVSHLSPRRELQLDTVAPLHHILIARLDHPLAAMSNPTAAQVLAYPLILPSAGLTTEAQISHAYIKAGLSPTPPQYVCDHFGLVKRLVASTNAISPVVSLAPTSERFRHEFSVLEDVIELVEQAIGIVTPRNQAVNAATGAFIDIFKSFLQDAEV